MKEIIKNFYLVAFRALGWKGTAYVLAVATASVLTFSALSGVAMLLGDLPSVKTIRFVFTFPNAILTVAAITGLLFYFFPSSVIATRNLRKKPDYMLVLLTILVVVAIYGYKWFSRALG